MKAQTVLVLGLVLSLVLAGCGGKSTTTTPTTSTNATKTSGTSPSPTGTGSAAPPAPPAPDLCSNKLLYKLPANDLEQTCEVKKDNATKLDVGIKIVATSAGAYVVAAAVGDSASKPTFNVTRPDGTIAARLAFSGAQGNANAAGDKVADAPANFTLTSGITKGQWKLSLAGVGNNVEVRWEMNASYYT